LPGLLARVDDLLVRQIEGFHAHSVVLRHVQRQRAPPATGFGHRFARLELQFAAHMIHLGRLRFFKRGRRSWKIRACVQQLPVQPSFVEICRQIVVMVHVRAGTPRAVSLESFDPARLKPCEPAPGCRAGPRIVRCFEQCDEIALHCHLAIGVFVTESDFRLKNRS